VILQQQAVVRQEPFSTRTAGRLSWARRCSVLAWRVSVLPSCPRAGSVIKSALLPGENEQKMLRWMLAEASAEFSVGALHAEQRDVSVQRRANFMAFLQLDTVASSRDFAPFLLKCATHRSLSLVYNFSRRIVLTERTLKSETAVTCSSARDQ
jgi:hypothetical protein